MRSVWFGPFGRHHTMNALDLFQKALDNVKEYHMRQTMTDPEDALDQALRDFYNEEKSTEDVGMVLSGD